MDFQNLKNSLKQAISQASAQNKKVLIVDRASPLKDADFGLLYIEINLSNNSITFTTDTPDYKGPKSVDEIMQELYDNFDIFSFNILIHSSLSKSYDKDISLSLKKVPKKQLTEKTLNIIEFILENYFDVPYCEVTLAD